MNTLFPIYVKMDQVRTLLVGAGPVGLEKLQAIFRNSPQAHVYIVAERVDEEVRAFLADKPTASLSQRSFEVEDLENIGLVVLATNNERLNAQIRQLTIARNILLNVADKPTLCDFYLGSVVQKGNLKIGISTNGKSPTMAKRLKEILQAIVPEEIDEALVLMQQMRDQLKGDLQEKIKVLNAHTQELVDKNRS
ncbi:bifunctional precorrin-2 dehydrogenase/sirohydrochlorin ferrochelatase [Sphingobacterium sp. SGG-5]|uniref:precorrin-2 dehydrogenase/sirohydrochlorin ferrochelatase family protein n=1 Tax=Sphingobacterium sp. SGG-5 TaxID=2710881 RepID=UPI0013E9D7EC|nr:bifunctional precorrin-2 dehydrogenase/sirohydrochlorin ferrochelatase [Sphingobacterium sp. SGG-5]NGM61880.1 bifunctional precorrin-2 dehydrogenase/sirohydrochlorin ferrochelatase [Sphingobacterium sp. SGG-5]